MDTEPTLSAITCSSSLLIVARLLSTSLKRSFMGPHSQDSARLSCNTLREQGDTLAGVPKEDYRKLIERFMEAVETRAVKKWGKDVQDNDSELSRKLGVAPNSVGNWAEGKQPSLKRMAQVANSLGTEVWKLLHPDIEQLEKDLKALARYRKAEKEGE
jgi:transcriptional regulator with XRE-family HTH domain